MRPQKRTPLVTTGLLGMSRHFRCNSTRSLISALSFWALVNLVRVRRRPAKPRSPLGYVPTRKCWLRFSTLGTPINRYLHWKGSTRMRSGQLEEDVARQLIVRNGWDVCCLFVRRPATWYAALSLAISPHLPLSETASFTGR